MLAWLVACVIASLLLSGLQPWLGRLGWGRLPLDLRWRWAGRDWHLPLGSTLLASALFWVVTRLLR